MNIFTLSPPAEIPNVPCPLASARMHCDQHLHKMILESAQMLSTALPKLGISNPFLYKAAYEKHPCTIWVSSSPSNALWLCELAAELEEIRQELGNCSMHSSSEIIKYCADSLKHYFPEQGFIYASPHSFAGPTHLALRKDIPIWQKYQRYYQIKAKEWLDKGRPMTYKHRPIPDFMENFL